MDRKENFEPLLDAARVNLRVALTLRNTDATNTSKKAGLSPNTLSSFLREESKISYLNLLKVCEALDIPIGILHQDVGITTARIRLHNLLEAMPDHELSGAIDLARHRIR